VQFLVICRPALLAPSSPPQAGDPDEFERLVPFETEAMREQKARGTLTGAWSLGHPGAVLMLEVADTDAAARILAGFPLVEAGLISTEIIPLYPIEL
jgi:muconolactone delta-isomerase